MATVDLTGGQGTGEFMPSRLRGIHVVEKTFDVAKLIADSTITAVTTGDIFQVLDVPAECFLLHAGAEVLTAFTGTSPTADIDFAAGDDLRRLPGAADFSGEQKGQPLGAQSTGG